MSEAPHTPEQSIPSDRDIPSVADTKDLSKIGLVAFLFIGILAIIAVVLDGMKKNEHTLLTDPQEISYKVPYSNSGPYIQPISEPDDTALHAPAPDPEPVIDHLARQREYQMQQEALRLAREEQQRLQERLVSKQLIYDDAASIAGLTLSGQSQSNGSSLLSGGGDPNLNFANQYANADIETASATQLQNLHALISQGTMIDGILETAIQSDLPGMVRAIVASDVYSFDGSHLLIPKGSKLIGRYNSALVRGQSRVFVIWNRLLRSDGVSINIGSFGTDDLGRSGLAGELDTHFFERFGSSVLLSLIDASIQIGVNESNDNNTANVALNTGGDFSRAAEIALENSIAIPPTVHIHQGTRIKVFTGKDLDFSKVAGNAPRR